MRFYRSDSESDTGTLHQLRNYIQRRNVKGKVKGNFSPSEEFLNIVTRVHVIAAALDHFKMPSMDSHRMVYNIIISSTRLWVYIVLLCILCLRNMHFIQQQHKISRKKKWKAT